MKNNWCFVTVLVCFGGRPSTLQEVREHRVLDCRFFHTMEGTGGFAVMTNCYQFFVVSDTSRPRDEIRVKKVADLPCKFKLYN